MTAPILKPPSDRWVTQFNGQSRQRGKLVSFRQPTFGRQTRIQLVPADVLEGQRASADEEDTIPRKATQRKVKRPIVGSSDSDADDDLDDTVKHSRPRRKQTFATRIIILEDEDDEDKDNSDGTSNEDKDKKSTAGRSRIRRVQDVEAEREQQQRTERKSRNEQALRRLKSKSRYQGKGNQSSVQSLLRQQPSITGRLTRSKLAEGENTAISDSPSSSSSNDNSDSEYGFIVDDGEEYEETADESAVSDNEDFDSQERARNFLKISTSQVRILGKQRQSPENTGRQRIVKTRIVDCSDDENVAAEESDVEYGDNGEGTGEDEMLPENDFVVRDTRNTRATNIWKSEMPSEFNSMARQPLSAQFAVFVQLLASECLEPGFIAETYAEKDQYFTYVSDKIDGVVDSIKESLVKSQSWKPDFKSCLDQYHEHKDSEILPEEGCDACFWKNRISTKLMVFSGERYDRVTLQKIRSREKRNSVRNESTEFRLGKHCYQRASLYHDLHHFKYNLRNRIEEELEAIKSVDFDPEDGEKVAALVTNLLSDGVVVNQLFQEFKELIGRGESYSG